MNINSLFSYWKDSLQFFIQKNLKLFILATLNNFQRSLVIMAKNFWWQIILFLIFKLLMHDYAFLFQGSSKTAWFPLVLRSLGMGGFIVASLYMLFFFILAVRPSMELKNYTYFNRYQHYLWGFFLLYLFMHIVALPNLLPFIIISTLFFTDLQSSHEHLTLALKNGLKVFLYFLPIITTFLLIYCGASLGLSYLESIVRIASQNSYQTGNLLEKIMYVGIIPLMLTTLAMLFKFLYIASLGIYYIKIKHQHHSLFFKG